MSEREPEILFVSTEWLANHLNEPQLRIVDIRGHVLPASEPPPHYFSHREDYEEAHISRAVFVDWTADIVEPESASNDIANPVRYKQLMESLGIGDDTFVVAYDDANGMFAARFWWTLRYYGHEAAAVLAGGWSQWVAENRPVTDDLPEPQPAVFTPEPQPDLLATADTILNRAPDVAILDVRSTGEFAGESSRAARKGHIPGAINVPRKRLLDDDGKLRSPDDLRAILQEAGLSLDVPEVIVYCNSGVSASFGMMALKAAGIEQARVYDGSWKDWGNDDTKPVE